MSTPPVTGAPGIGRRLASLLYEALLLLALALITGLIVAAIKVSAFNDMPQFLFQSLLGVACGGAMVWYFAWFWRHGGQTLPMKTWHIRLVPMAPEPISFGRALLRIFFAALLYGPACAGAALIFFPQRLNPAITVWLFVPMIAAWWWARFDPDRQFLHDRLAGTRQIAA